MGAGRDSGGLGEDALRALHEAGLTILERYRPPAWLKPSFVDRTGFHLLFQGEAGQGVRLQRSQDLRGWEDWVVMPATGISQEIVDPSAVGRDQQFYRAVTP